MNISFDLDGVVTDSFHWGVYTDYVIHNRTKRVSFEEFWIHCDEDHNKLEQDNWTKTDIYYSHKNITFPDRDTIRSLKSKGHMLFYITSRPNEVTLTTQLWLERNRLPDIDNLIFSNRKDIVLDTIGANLHIEDMVHHANKTRLSCRTLLLNQVWNLDYSAEGVTRIYRLQEVENYV